MFSKYLNSSITKVLKIYYSDTTLATNKLMVHVYLSKEEKEKIAKEAKALGISVSAYIKVRLFYKNAD